MSDRALVRRLSWSVAVLAVAVTSASGSADGEDVLARAAARLLSGQGFLVDITGRLESRGAAVTELQATGAYVDPVTYRFEFTTRSLGEEQRGKVVRIGDRQWEWSETRGIWRATRAASSAVAEALTSGIAALAQVEHVEEGPHKDCDGVPCAGYTFTVPPGVATYQGLTIEGKGTAYVGVEDGLLRELLLDIATPFGAVGQVVLRVFGYEAEVRVAAPGLGALGPAPVAVPSFAAEAVESAVNSQELVRLEVEATAESVGAQTDLARFLPIRATLVAFPAERRAVLVVAEGGEATGERIVIGDTVLTKREPAGDEAPVSEWTMERGGVGTEIWEGYHSVLRNVLGTLSPRPAGPAEVGRVAAWAYTFDPVGAGQPAGFVLPLFAGWRAVESSGRLLVARDTMAPILVEMSLSAADETGALHSVRETYRFSYELSADDRRAILRKLDWGAAEIEARLESEARVRERALDLARRAASLIQDTESLAQRLRTLHRTDAAAHVWVYATDGSLLAATADAPTVAVAEDGSLDEAARVPPDTAITRWSEGSWLAVAAVRVGRQVRGFVVVRGAPVRSAVAP